MANNVFKTRYKGPTGGDETAPYYVDLKKEATIGEFINGVLEETGEWGCIVIRIHGKNLPVGTVNYSHGEIEGTMAIGNEYLEKPVTRVLAHGGWTNMNYVIYG